jgi:hypothetical protein
MEVTVNEERFASELCEKEAWAQDRKTKIVPWLHNFHPDHRSLAMELLRNVDFFSKQQCYEWCQNLHTSLPSEISQSNNTFYVGIGSASESGSLVSYYYRTANELDVTRFLDLTQAADPIFLQHRNARNLVFVDDFIGSGNQATRFWQSFSSRLGHHIHYLRFYYSAFIGRREGKTNIEEHTRFRVSVVRHVTDSHKAFGDSSPLFKEGCREAAKAIFWDYGYRLYPNHPLGFRDSQMLIILDHNTPNNTLPVLWSKTKGWVPLFDRSEKVYLPSSLDSRPKDVGKFVRRSAIMLIGQVNMAPGLAGRSVLEAAQVESEQERLTAEVVSHYGGAIIKSLGDKALVQFTSYRDAVGCGFALQQSVREWNAAQSNARLMLELRIGIDSGEVVTLPDDNLAGGATKRVARVCAQCPAGEVHFTESAKPDMYERDGKYSWVSNISLKNDQAEKEPLFCLLEWFAPTDSRRNPFIWRGGITTAEEFFGRGTEQQMIRNCLRDRQNCQIVGPRRIGKTSLLRQIERSMEEWEGTEAVTAYVDLRSPRSFTLDGWLEQIGRQLNCATTLRSLADFLAAIQSILASGNHPILLLDEFEELTLRPTEFTSDFFLSLRSSGLLGLSIITTSQKGIDEMSGPSDTAFEYFKTFAPVPLTGFSYTNVEDFLHIDREGMDQFKPDERKAIQDFAQGHPLDLQIASFQVLEAKRRGESLSAAIRRANDYMKAYLPF